MLFPVSLLVCTPHFPLTPPFIGVDVAVKFLLVCAESITGAACSGSITPHPDALLTQTWTAGTPDTYVDTRWVPTHNHLFLFSCNLLCRHLSLSLLSCLVIWLVPKMLVNVMHGRLASWCPFVAKTYYCNFVEHCKCDICETLGDGSTYWALPMLTSLSDLDCISRSKQCQTVLNGNFMFLLDC